MRPFLSPYLTWKKLLIALFLVLILSISTAALFHPPIGFNYSIYVHNASMVLHDINPYTAAGPSGVDFRNPVYLDYTGLQLLIYTGCQLITDHTTVNGYVLVSLILVIAAIACVFYLWKSGQIVYSELLSFQILMLSPYVWFVLYFKTFEDKTVFLLFPVLLYLAYRRSDYLGIALLGLFSGWIGAPVFILPVFLWDIFKKSGLRRVAIAFFLFSGVLALALIPFFPSSLQGWVHRFNRENSLPFWFSIWHALQLDSFYFPGMNKIFTLGFSLSIYGLFYFKRLDIRQTVILLALPMILFSPHNGPQRLVPFIPILALAYKRPAERIVFTSTASLILLFCYFWDINFLIFTHYPSPQEVGLLSLVLFSPLLNGLIILGVALFNRDSTTSVTRIE